MMAVGSRRSKFQQRLRFGGRRKSLFFLNGRRRREAIYMSSGISGNFASELAQRYWARSFDLEKCMLVFASESAAQNPINLPSFNRRIFKLADLTGQDARL
jgi:hypothetical protein